MYLGAIDVFRERLRSVVALGFNIGLSVYVIRENALVYIIYIRKKANFKFALLVSSSHLILCLWFIYKKKDWKKLIFFFPFYFFMFFLLFFSICCFLSLSFSHLLKNKFYCNNVLFRMLYVYFIFYILSNAVIDENLLFTIKKMCGCSLK